MASITVTINDHTGGPFQLSELFAGNTYSSDVTIAPATPLQPQSKPSYIAIQADPANSMLLVYVGDKNVDPAVPQCGAKLAAGDSNVVQDCVQSLTQRYVNGDDGAVINIEVLGGFQ